MSNGPPMLMNGVRSCSPSALMDTGDDAANSTTWAVHVVNKLGNLFQTHVLQIDLISPANSDSNGGA